MDEQLQLAHITNQQAAASAEIVFKVMYCNVVNYSYSWNGQTVHTQKVQSLLLTSDRSQYCLGNARTVKKNKKELEGIAQKFAQGTVWKISNMKLLDDKAQWIHTPCRIVIDLRSSKCTKVLQSPSAIPSIPEPRCSIKDILKLQKLQRFDILAIVTEVIQSRRTGGGIPVADIRLKDGSLADDGTKNSLPLTLFFNNDKHFETLQGYVGKVPLVFLCLQGWSKDGKLHVATVKDETRWFPGEGDKFDRMQANATELCDESPSTDVLDLAEFVPQEARDYRDCAATLTCCRLLNRTDQYRCDLLGESQEHLYQLNYVYVTPPHPSDTLLTKDGKRLWTQALCTDGTKTITLAIREKAMLQLAGLAEGDKEIYQEQCRNSELRYPILSSLRILVRPAKTTSDATQDSSTQPTQDASEAPSSQQEQDVNEMVVEAEVQDFNAKACPNEAMVRMYRLLENYPSTGDRLAFAYLEHLSSSPFYNLTANDVGVDKALVLIQSTQKSVAKNLASGYHVQTCGVTDALDNTAQHKYKTLVFCTVEQSLTYVFSPLKKTGEPATAWAVISKVVDSNDETHRLELMVEAMQHIEASEKDDAIKALKILASKPIPWFDAN